MKHPAMLCAIFLDPRIHRELELNGGNELQIARMTLANLNERIFNLNGEQAKENANNSFDEYFNQCAVLEVDNEQQRRNQFTEVLDHFHRSLQYMKLEPKQTIHDFWECNKKLFPCLYEVACVIHAIPPSQATVERAFSALKFIFGELRTKIDQERLENLLLIKLNGDMADSINQSDIEKIENRYESK